MPQRFLFLGFGYFLDVGYWNFSATAVSAAGQLSRGSSIPARGAENYPKVKGSFTQPTRAGRDGVLAVPDLAASFQAQFPNFLCRRCHSTLGPYRKLFPYLHILHG